MQTLAKIEPREYLELEAKAQAKSEYADGEIIAMAGAQLPHNQVVNNLIYLINACVWGKNCQVLPSDMLLKLPECEKYVYPDVMIVCGKPSLEKQAGLDVLLNPTVIIEVLSEHTGEYDQTEKMQCYLALKGLEQYIMIDSRKIHAMSYTKSDAEWVFRITSDQKTKIKIHQCDITLEDIYNNVVFEKAG